jgi:hypothetical protein
MSPEEVYLRVCWKRAEESGPPLLSGSVSDSHRNRGLEERTVIREAGGVVAATVDGEVKESCWGVGEVRCFRRVLEYSGFVDRGVFETLRRPLLSGTELDRIGVRGVVILGRSRRFVGIKKKVGNSA